MDKKSVRSKKEEEALRNLVFVKEQKPPPANKIQKELCKLMYCNKAFMILQNETDPDNFPLDFTGLHMYGFEVPDPTEEYLDTIRQTIQPPLPKPTQKSYFVADIIVRTAVVRAVSHRHAESVASIAPAEYWDVKYRNVYALGELGQDVNMEDFVDLDED